MKNKILFLIFFIFACESFADDDVRANQPFAMIEEDDDEEDGEDYVHKGALPLEFEQHKKAFSNNLVLDLNFNDNYRTSDSRNEYNETTARARFFSRYEFKNNFSLNSQIDLIPFYKADEASRRNALAQGGGDRSFEDGGIQLRQLNLQYDNKKYAAIAGKMNLNYGRAWNWNRGIWSYELANNYRQADKIGFGGVYRAGDAKKTGQYNFGLSFFKNDRKYLHNALITRDDQIANKAGDESLFESYAAAMDVNFDFGEKEKLYYHFGYLNLAVNKHRTNVSGTKAEDQKGFVASMNYLYPVIENYDIDALVEFNQFKNIDGNSGAAENYLTANIINKFFTNYLLTLSYSERFSKVENQSRLNQQLSEISVGYEFKKNAFFDRFIIQTGYKNMRNNYYSSLESNNSFGVLLRYYKNF